MIKLLLVACAIASSIFMVTQLVTLYYFNNFFPTTTRDVENLELSNELIQSIQQLQSSCKHFNLNLTLIDEEFLQEFLSLEISHRKFGIHNHHDCQVFCGKSVVTFMIDGAKVHNEVDEFIGSLQHKGYLTTYDEDYDKRQESLEHRHGFDKLIYHIFLEANNTLIHVVLSYVIQTNYMWNHKCNPYKIENKKWFPLLSNKRFCEGAHMFKPIEPTSALIDGIHILIPQYVRTYLEEIEDINFKFCNYHQARSFYSTYGYDSTYESEAFRSKAGDLLKTVTEVLSRLKVRFWLSSGTCLGWFRQCDFIPHSKDVDIGIWITDYNEKIIDAFEQKGLKLTHLFGKIEDSFELSFTMGVLKLDIFFFYKENGYMWNGGTQVKTGKKFKYKFDNFSLCWTLFKGLHVRVPCDTEKYILANYGEGWGTLLKEWDWKSSPPNVQENGEWPIEERKMVIKMY